MMRKMTFTVPATLAVLLTVGASDVVGQIGPRPERATRGEAVAQRGRPGASAVEGILRLRDRLELTDDQASQLDALRSEEVARRSRDAAELAELQSRLRAGTIERSEAREQMQALREARRSVAEESRTAVADILDDEQEAELEELRARRRAFEAGRRSAMRGQDRGPVRPGRIQGRRGVRAGG